MYEQQTHDVRALHKDEFTAASLLVRRVFQKFEAPDYSPAGIETFHACILPDELQNRDQAAILVGDSILSDKFIRSECKERHVSDATELRFKCCDAWM